MARRHRAANHIKAMESGPPDTARTSARAFLQSAKSDFASLADICKAEGAFGGFIACAISLVFRFRSSHELAATLMRTSES
jgi:hypothetical protein